jgi:hypothetical protein
MNIFEAPYLKRLKFQDTNKINLIYEKEMNPDKCNQVAVYFSWEDNWLKNIRITFNAKNWATDTLYIYSRKQLPTNKVEK